MTMRASINSFGFGGANAHVVIDGAVQYLEHRDLSVVHQNADPSSSAIPHQPSGSSSTLSVPGLFIYSAQDQKRVKAMLRDHASYLRTKSISLDSLVDYSYTLLCRRSRLAYSTAIIADSTASLLAQLGEADKLIITRLPGRHTKPRVGFVFCGQGACRSGMFEGLWHYKPFHESVQDACRFLNRLAPMLDFLNLFRSSWQDIFDSPVLAQTASTVFQVALVDFLAACSVEPMAVVGHSSGEIAAAYAARIVDRETAWLLAFLRGKAATTALPGGGMLAAAMSLADAQDVLARTKRDSSVTVGCVNSPSSVTFSGAKTTLKGLADDLKARKIRCTMLKVSVAYHSNCMEEPADVYYRAIPSYQLQKQSSIRMFSSVTGELIGAPAMTAEYWRANMVSPVLFDKALGAMMGPISDTTSSPDILVEISPSAVLRTPISQTLEAAGTTPADVKYLPMQDKSVDNKQPLKVLGELIHACYQVKMDWMQRSDGGRPKCLVDLPSYPWNHERAYWHEPQGTRALRQRAHGREDLIGAPSTHLFEQEPRWRGAFRLHENPWIKDHQVQRSVMYPAAGMAAMAFEGAKQMFERLGAGAPAQLSGFEVCDLYISAPMLIPATQRGLDHSMTAQRVNPSLAGPEVFAAYQFSIFSRMDTSDWQKNAKGVFKLKTHSDGLVPLGDPSPNNVREISEGGMKSHHLYQRLDNIGMKYGPTFRAVTSVGVATEAVEDGVTTRSCMLRLRIPDTAKVMPFNFEYEHFIHPATLDAVIHSVFALDSAPMVPVHVDSIKIAESFPRNAGTELLAYCEATDDGKPNVMADVTVYDAPGASPVLTVRGLQLARLSPGAESGFLSSHRSLCSTVEWNMDPLAHLPAPNTKDFLAWLTSLLLKKPDLRILFAIEDTALAIEMLLRVTGGADRAVTCSRFTFTAVAQSVHDAVLADAHSRFQGVLPIIELSSGTTPTAERTGRYDLVVVGETHAQLLEPFLKAGGFVYHQQTQTVVAKQPSTDPVDKDTKLLVVLLVATDHKVKSEYEAILADVTAFVQSEHANSQVILTDDMNLESYSTQEVHVVSFLDLSKGHNVSLCADQYAAVQKLLLSKTYASMLWITHGAQMDCKNAGEATMIGIVRTIRSEDPGKKITCLDLDVSDAGEGTLAMDHVISLLRKSILSRHARGVAEPEAEYAVKHGVLHFARLRPVTALNRFIEEARYSGASTPSPFSVKLQGTGTYLIVGGLGGLGREIAKLLVARGARHLCFVSRRAVASSDEVAKLALWLGGTAKIVLYQADVCDAQQLRDVLDQMAQQCPPLKGVIQAAAVVKVSHPSVRLSVPQAWTRPLSSLPPEIY
jgi:acyl transferase domain-containing protein